MKIYVAAHCRWAGLYVAEYLEDVGFEIVSRWLYEPFGRVEEYGPDDRQRLALMDLEDVKRADALVLVAGPDRYPGGKFVETGIALGAGIPVVIIGRRENMLLWNPSVPTVAEPGEAANVLRSLNAA